MFFNNPEIIEDVKNIFKRGANKNNLGISYTVLYFVQEGRQ